MALGLQTIREALETRLSTYLASGSRQTNVYAYPPETLQYPAIGIHTGEGDYITYWETMSDSGVASVRFVIRIYAAARYVDAQMAVDAYLSAGSGFTSSIVNAILADKTLGGTVETCRLLEARGLVPDEVTGGWVADVPIEIYARKVAA